MHQFDTIVAAIELAIQHGNSNAIPAILKEYFMDEQFVPKQDRHDLLVLINNRFDSKYSLTAIKKGNPVTLKTLPFELPEKAVLVRADKVVGATELPADSKLITETPNNAAQQGNIEMQNVAQQSQDQDTTADNAALTNTQGDQDTNGKPGKPNKSNKDKRNDQVVEVDLSKAEAKRFAKAFVDAHAKGKVKKDNRHVKLVYTMNSIDEYGVNTIYPFMRPTIKFLVQAIKELPGMRDADHRATVFETWVAGDAGRAKAFKKFHKRASKVLEKEDHIMALFLLLSEENLRWSIDFANYAYTDSEEGKKNEIGDDDTYAFVRENSNGVNPRWTAAAGAAIGGGIDMALNGFNISSAVGTAAGAGAAFFAGGLLEDQIENPHLRDLAAGALGGTLGVLGSRVGRTAGNALFGGDDDTMVEADSTVVATIPAQVVTQRTQPVTEQNNGGILTGLTALMMS